MLPGPHGIGVMKDDKNTKNYKMSATLLGCLQIIYGVISLVAATIGISYGGLPPMGITISLFFIVTGVLTFAEAHTDNKCLQVGNMVIAILTTVLAGALFIMSSIWLSTLVTNKSFPAFQTQDSFSEASWALSVQMGISLVMLLTGICSLVLNYRSGCFATNTK